ncbi:PREDICTED: G-protein-signaling modulator 2 [Rhagoletis zephyria]|uniref:G-protein-signaling modulator 2 n=1 Tax=Rhagoletis zephyria TaxID=28612 RepID=UPI00081157E4|nr:PREDICTED: G-protein-signaling modulator 2 [Rhagoletis zephyria]
MSSLSASAENVSSTGGAASVDQTAGASDGSSSMCLELALEGERLCKAGDCRAGVAFFQAAIQAGTNDLRTLSAIYSQLGNAYFYLGDYAKAMQYHKLDLTLARTMNDKLGEAKSSGNLGNTLKVMGRFNEAAICCDRHLTLARQLGDKLSEGRALYNLGNVYHAKGKHMGQGNLGDYGDDVRDALSKAVDFYQENLKLMRELGDRGAQGRACGNLGNTYYLLGNFQKAIEHHQERLCIAREFGDRAAERRANSNLGNSHIFLGQFEEAAEHYKRTLALAIELGEREVEAQACYSLGNTYTLLREFSTAIDYHHRHLAIAQELGDRVGEARACWSLGNAHSAIGNHEKALLYAEAHLNLAVELQDSVGESTARVNIFDLRKLLGLPASPIESEERSIASDISAGIDQRSDSSGSSQSRMVRVRRQSMEQLDLIKITPDGKRAEQINIQEQKHNQNASEIKGHDEDFFEFLSRSQSKRMDDQRCSIKIAKNPPNSSLPKVGGTSSLTSSTGATRKPLAPQNSMTSSNAGDEVVSAAKSSNNSNASSGPTSGSHHGHGQLARSNTTTQQPDDAFLEMLMRCQGSRLEEQRSELPRSNITMDAEAPTRASAIDRGRSGGNSAAGGRTVPDEDFFSLIMKVQSGRMEDQRAAIPGFGGFPQRSTGNGAAAGGTGVNAANSTNNTTPK